jgi:hypothetical protein
VLLHTVRRNIFATKGVDATGFSEESLDKRLVVVNRKVSHGKSKASTIVIRRPTQYIVTKDIDIPRGLTAVSSFYA